MTRTALVVLLGVLPEGFTLLLERGVVRGVRRARVRTLSDIARMLPRIEDC